MNRPLVTVYITNYNYAQYIERAIESLLNQTFTDYEALIIDDGSVDHSKEIIERYADRPNFKIIYQQNRGLIVTNNIALRLAQGKFIMRLDADDYLDPNALALMVEEMKKDDDLGLVFPNYFIVDKDDNIINYRKRIATEKNNVKDNPAHGACTLIRKKFLDSIGGYDETFTCQDGYYLWINFFSKFKVKNIETPLFYYRRHNSNLTNNSERILTTRSNIISKIVNESELALPKALAIIPIRGPDFNVDSIALKKFIGDKSVLEYKIEQTLQSSCIDKVAVTTPDDEVIDAIKGKYDDRVIIIKRDSELARLNSGLVDTIKDVFEQHEAFNEYDAFMTLSIRFPLLKPLYIDNAIKSMALFQTESVISVRTDNSKFFQSTHNGLKPILDQEKFTKLEREDLYRYSGGMILTQKEFFYNNNQFIGHKNGHVIIDAESAIMLKDKLSFEYVHFIKEQKLKSTS